MSDNNNDMEPLVYPPVSEVNIDSESEGNETESIEIAKIKLQHEIDKFKYLSRTSMRVFYIMLFIFSVASLVAVVLAFQAKQADTMILNTFISKYEKDKSEIKIPFTNINGYSDIKSIFEFKPGITPKTPLFFILILFSTLLIYHYSVIKVLKNTSQQSESMWTGIFQLLGGVAAMSAAWYFQSTH